MKSVLSHIVSQRLSQEYENIATDALAFILKRNGSAREGFMNVLREVLPELPDLHFRTQHSTDGSRPDMWGFDGGDPRVFVENKFWAWLTPNQPVTYLEHLSDCGQPSLLLFVAPKARLETVWLELLKRVATAELPVEDPISSKNGLIRSVRTGSGRMMALISWQTVLSYVGDQLEEGTPAHGDLEQLRALCGTADVQAFKPFASEELTDQRLPAFILQMKDLLDDIENSAEREGLLSFEGVRPSNNWNRLGRYVKFPTTPEPFGAFFGLYFALWRDHGTSPLWIRFPASSWGRSLEAEQRLADWCRDNHLPGVDDGDAFAVPLPLPVGQEKASVVLDVVDQLRNILGHLRAVEPRR